MANLITYIRSTLHNNETPARAEENLEENNNNRFTKKTNDLLEIIYNYFFHVILYYTVLNRFKIGKKIKRPVIFTQHFNIVVFYKNTDTLFIITST